MIHERVLHYFPDIPTHQIRVDKGHVFMTCPASPDPDPDPNFIHFHIAAPHMMLHYLRRCSEIRGTDILQRIIALGQDLSLHTIELHDASLIRCDFPLYTLSILQHGETWYHRMGFRSPSSSEDTIINNALRQEKWEDFVRKMFNVYEARIGRDREERGERVATYLREWYRAFPMTEGHTVAEVVNMINWKGIPCDHPHTNLLRDFLYKADSILEYDSNLTLDLHKIRSDRAASTRDSGQE